MNIHVQKASISSLTMQRNALLGITVILCFAIIILSCFIFLKRERIVVLPGSIGKEFWLDVNTVSPTYLEQTGLFLGQLLLSKSHYSAHAQRAVILRHTDNGSLATIKARLIEEETVLAKQNISYTFFPTDTKVDTANLSVVLTGDRIAMVGSEKVSTQRETYVLKFNYDGSRLLLTNVEAKEKVKL